jgi:hypothetical protein
MAPFLSPLILLVSATKDDHHDPVDLEIEALAKLKDSRIGKRHSSLLKFIVRHVAVHHR